MQPMTSQFSERKVLYGRIFFAVMAVAIVAETLLSYPLFGAAFWGGIFAALMMIAVALQAEMLFMPFKRTVGQYKALKYRKIADRITAAAFICLTIGGVISLIQSLQ